MEGFYYSVKIKSQYTEINIIIGLLFKLAHTTHLSR